MNETLLNPQHLLATVVYALLGIFILISSIWVLDKITPKNLWHEIIENKNLALGAVAGGMMIAVAFIIAAAIHSSPSC